jgi:hypothetical protein
VSALCWVAGLAGFASAAFETRYTVLVAVACTFGVVAVFLDFGGRDRRARALAACFWTTAAAFAARGVSELSVSWAGATVPHVLASLRPDAFFALAVWQFARDFPRVTRFGRLDVLCIWGVRAATAIGAVLFGAGVMPLVMPNSSVARALAPTRGTGAAELAFWSLVFGAALAGLAVIAWRGRLAEGTERARVRLFLYAMVCAFGPIMTVVVVSNLAPAYLRLIQTPRGFFWTALVVYPPMLMLPAATAYAVMARDVLDVRLVIQRGLRYLLARWLLLWGAAVPIGLLLVHLYRYADQSLNASLAAEPAPTLLWFAGVGAIVLAFRGRLIRALDEWALPGVEEPSTALAAMTERMKQARTPLEVAVRLAEAIERATQAPAHAYLHIDGALLPSEGGEPVLPVESAIPALMEGAREPSVVAGASRRSYYSLLLETDRAWIDAEKIEVVVPVLTGRTGGGLVGLVTLSRRRNALGFTDDDMRFVRAAAAAASLACDAITSEGRLADMAMDGGLDEVALQCLRCGHVEERASGLRLCACGGAWEPAALPKRVLSRFELLEWVGAGGMGVVYRASDLRLGRDVALKTLPALSDGAVERLMAEARTMASLAHEDVAVLYGVEHWHGTPLLVMEYLAGGTLAACLQQRQLGESELIELFRRLARSLARIHERGLYHGDIKPSNIGLAPGGAPKLLDFGLSRALSMNPPDVDDVYTPEAGAPLGGTWAYLAPEVRNGAAPGPGLDLWALGLVWCEALLGGHPFPRARSGDEMTAGISTACARLCSERSPAHERVVATMLAPEAAARPATAAAFERLLAELS